VLLVLLIIFMVITPLTPKGLEALVPQPPPPNQKTPPPTDRTIVVQLIDHGAGNPPGLKINQDEATWETLQGRLEDIFKTRAEKVMFVKGDDNVPFAGRRRQGGLDHSQDRSGRVESAFGLTVERRASCPSSKLAAGRGRPELPLSSFTPQQGDS
jgi:hypothetical protein